MKYNKLENHQILEYDINHDRFHSYLYTMKPFKLSGRIWLTKNNENVLGSGKVQLLDHIDSLGSLRKAAQQMEMSYRKAWYSVQKINSIAEEPIVILKRGGKDGGKATVTELGKKLLKNYKYQQLAFKRFLEQQNS